LTGHFNQTTDENMRALHLVIMRVVSGRALIVVIRGFISSTVVRARSLLGIRVMFVPVVTFRMGMLDDQGRPTVRQHSEKRGKHQQPPCKDGVEAVLFA